MSAMVGEAPTHHTPGAAPRCAAPPPCSSSSSSSSSCPATGPTGPPRPRKNSRLASPGPCRQRWRQGPAAAAAACLPLQARRRRACSATRAVMLSRPCSAWTRAVEAAQGQLCSLTGRASAVHLQRTIQQQQGAPQQATALQLAGHSIAARTQQATSATASAPAPSQQRTSKPSSAGRRCSVASTVSWYSCTAAASRPCTTHTSCKAPEGLGREPARNWPGPGGRRWPCSEHTRNRLAHSERGRGCAGSGGQCGVERTRAMPRCPSPAAMTCMRPCTPRTLSRCLSSAAPSSTTSTSAASCRLLPYMPAGATRGSGAPADKSASAPPPAS
jgi:hypothetical protein